MQDLTNLLPGDPISALVPTSQHGGNQVADNSHAMTAPGGASGDLGNDLGTAVVIDSPVVDDTPHKDSVTRSEAPPKNGNPFPKGSAAPSWVSASGTAENWRD